MILVIKIFLAGLLSLSLFSLTALADQPPAAVLEQIASSYDAQITSQAYAKNILIYFNDTCEQTNILIKARDPVTHEMGSLFIKDYIPLEKGKVNKLRSVIVVPPTGGENRLDTDYAQSLCFDGFRAAIVERWTGDDDKATDLGMHDRNMLRMLTAIRHTIEYLNPTRPNQVGLLGASLGAITGALAVGYDSRLNVATLIVAGGNMPHIIAQSDEEALKSLRKTREASLGLKNAKEYEDLLKKNVLINPIDFVHMSGPKKIYTVIGEEDTTVPTADQVALYKAFGSQQLSTQDSGHVWTIISTNLFRKHKVIEFFKDNLK